jgi:DNA-directed RNA polymerase III subunit RPC6
MQVADDSASLMGLIQELVDAHMLQVMTWEGQVCYKLRSRDEATKLKSMTPDERLIFSHIESSGTAGIWTKTIKAKTGVTQTIMTKCLKQLESKALIKAINNVKFPTRKMYMLAHLMPSEDVVGGPWHQDGELDVDLIEALSNIVVRFVERESWVEQKQKGPSKAAIAKKKAYATSSTNDIEAEPPLFKPPLGPHKLPLIPHPSSHRHYPTCASILAYIRASGVVDTSVALQEPDLQVLLDNLVFDGKVERMGALGYRSVRGAVDREGVGEEGYGNGFSQAPCGRCPVFALCEEGGPVNAKSCVYFTEWLRTS